MKAVLRIMNLIPGLTLVLVALSSGQAWASPINFKKQSDSQIWMGSVFALVLILVQALLGLYALRRYWRSYQITKKGPHPLLVLAVVILAVIFWSVVFYFYVTGQGAEYIG